MGNVYYDRQWRKARDHFLTANPLCIMCSQSGHTELATVVDHIQPHRGDYQLFWDRSNWQPLCKQHHDAAKQREERAGSVVGCDIDGIPLDNAHHWRK